MSLSCECGVTMACPECDGAELGQVRAEAGYWKSKAECYGDMVHACVPALASAGHLVEDSVPRSGAIARAVSDLARERDEARAEVERVRKERDELSVPLAAWQRNREHGEPTVCDGCYCDFCKALIAVEPTHVDPEGERDE